MKETAKSIPLSKELNNMNKEKSCVSWMEIFEMSLIESLMQIGAKKKQRIYSSFVK